MFFFVRLQPRTISITRGIFETEGHDSYALHTTPAACVIHSSIPVDGHSRVILGIPKLSLSILERATLWEEIL